LAFHSSVILNHSIALVRFTGMTPCTLDLFQKNEYIFVTNGS